MDNNNIIISVKDVCRSFQVGNQTVNALSGVSLDIEKGKLTVLRGRSGSGKTTLLNIMSALDAPTSGNVLFNGRDIAGFSNKEKCLLRRKNFGFVFQSVALISTMTAYENVEFAMRVAGADMKDRHIKIPDLFETVGLKNRYKHRPGELSGGEQQRVAIVRAIAHEPSIIFADEPTAELDTATGIKVVAIFKSLIEKSGVSVIMTSHDPNIIELADVIYELSDGKVIDCIRNTNGGKP